MKKQIVILAGGCFDVLHPGHIEFLTRSKSLGDSLVILLESDYNVKRLKGKNRPLNNQKTRIENLFNTNLVNIVIPLTSKVNDIYYQTIVKSINPDIIAITKGDPLEEMKRKQAESVGGKLEIVMDRNNNFSTSLIVESKNL